MTKGLAQGSAQGLAEGDKAPVFRLPDDTGAEVALRDFAGRKLVLFFYPKADTPGCTQEATDFSRLAKDFTKAGAAVVGVSADPVTKIARFKEKRDLTIPLLSDESHKTLTAYGVWGEKTLYGRKFMGIKRTTFLIGPDGRIARLWQNVKVAGHAAEVLTATRAL
jgi:peroxiredoxin Q/BCP